eukprot:TRINITY_DN22249_c0_g1_i2.p1 TRINITY_DN22249_c0_g1~~TRINITY_DN22249_c0_g1_i2.p1  ORF type:complete len:148 (-),score=29.91 TRINITY_DN22249_c0_g1_i2:8-424(-)
MTAERWGHDKYYDDQFKANKEHARVPYKQRNAHEPSHNGEEEAEKKPRERKPPSRPDQAIYVPPRRRRAAEPGEGLDFVIFRIEIKVGETREVKITKTDDPKELALKFCTENEVLHLVDPITKLIQDKLAQLFQNTSN